MQGAPVWGRWQSRRVSSDPVLKRLDNFPVLVYDYAVAGLVTGRRERYVGFWRWNCCPAEPNPGMESEVRTWK